MQQNKSNLENEPNLISFELTNTQTNFQQNRSAFDDLTYSDNEEEPIKNKSELQTATKSKVIFRIKKKINFKLRGGKGECKLKAIKWLKWKIDTDQP